MHNAVRLVCHGEIDLVGPQSQMVFIHPDNTGNATIFQLHVDLHNQTLNTCKAFNF